jgi:hypothetical protein
MKKFMLRLSVVLGLNAALIGAMALPIWLLWTVAGFGARYFPFLPEAWRTLPLLHVIGWLLLLSWLNAVWHGVKVTFKG